MKNSTPSKVASYNKAGAALRPGMHLDLVEHFDIGENLSDADKLSGLLDEAVCGESSSERLEAAHQALKAAKDGSCGLASLVLARETENLEAALEHGQAAVDALRKELLAQVESEAEDESKDESEIYEVSPELYTFAVADLAQLKWNAGLKKEAVELLTAHFSEPLNEIDSMEQEVLRDLATSFFIQMGDYKAAQDILQANSDNEAQWHYLNALIHFALTGDTLLSRSALTHGFASGSLLIANRLVSAENDSFKELLGAFGLERYIEDTEPAWHCIAGAIEWLAKVTAEPDNFSNREFQTIAIANGDIKRWQRWEDLLESAHHFSEQGNHKEARTVLKTALKEAERIDYSFLPFHASISELLDLYIDTKRPADDLMDAVEARAAKVEGAPNSPTNVMHLHSLGSLFEFFHEFEKAAEYHKKALQLAEEYVEAGQSFLNLFDLVDMRNDLAFVLFKLKQHSEALPLFLKNAETQERFLGPSHGEILESLEQAYECYIAMGEQSNADAVLARIKAIDSEYELNHDDDDSCDSCDHDHH